MRLTERIGRSRAGQLFYTASLVDAETLRAWGLVNEVVPAGGLMERAKELAREICSCSPEANRHIKALTTRMANSDTRAKSIRAELERFEEQIRGGDLPKAWPRSVASGSRTSRRQFLLWGVVREDCWWGVGSLRSGLPSLFRAGQSNGGGSTRIGTLRYFVRMTVPGGYC